MNSEEVVLYVSDNSPKCQKVLELVKDYNVSYKIKNVTQNSDYLKEIQRSGIYSTPAMFVPGEKESIQGYQKDTIQRALNNLSQKHRSH